MKKFALTLGVATAALAATIALAGPGYGPGNGPGAGTGCTAGTDTTCPNGMGPGMGGRGGRGHGAGPNLMTPEERTAHRNHMRSLTSVEACNDYVAKHHAVMVDRATKAGVTLPEPRGNACERMQARGRFG